MLRCKDPIPAPLKQTGAISVVQIAMATPGVFRANPEMIDDLSDLISHSFYSKHNVFLFACQRFELLPYFPQSF
jgi:hypothetical protein